MLARLEKLLLDLAAISVAGLGVLIAANVLLRAAFGSGVPDTVVLVRELMVAAVALPLAVVASRRRLINVDVVANALPPATQKALVVFGGVVGLFALAPLIFAGWRETAKAIESGSVFFGNLNAPKWPGRAIFLAGASFCWLRLLLMVIDDVRAIRAGESLDEILHRGED